MSDPEASRGLPAPEDAELEECADEIWEAVAALSHRSPTVLAGALARNLANLLEALLEQGLCTHEDVETLARCVLRAAGPGPDQQPT